MRSYTTTQARKYMAEIMDIVMAGEPVMITRRGSASAVLVSNDNFNAWPERKQDAGLTGILERYDRTAKMRDRLLSSRISSPAEGRDVNLDGPLTDDE